MNKTPKLRFPGFSGEWEEKKLKNIFKMYAGGDLDKKLFSKDKTKEYIYPVYSNGLENDGLYGYYKIFKETKDKLTVTARGVNIGAISVRRCDFTPVGRLLVLTPIKNKDYDLNFLKHNMSYKIKLIKEKTGVPQLTVPSYSSYSINLPVFEEQQKIANFFSIIDKKIEKQQEKVEALKDYKKGMMQKIFSREIRFKGDNDHWNQYLLGNIIELYDNKRKPVKEQDRVDGKYAYYGATGIIDYVNSYIFEGEYLLLGEDGANIITRSAPLIYKTQGKFWVNNHAHIFKPKKQFDIDFMKQCLELIDYTPYNTGTAQPKLNVESIKLIPLKAPCYKEQQKIATFLLTLDKKLEKEQEKLDSLNEWKKGLLQQMFV